LYNDIIPHSQAYGIGTSQHVSDQFFFRAERNKTIKHTVKLRFKVESIDHHHATSESMTVEIRKTSLNGNNDELTDREILFTANPFTLIGVETSIEEERTVFMTEGDSLSVVLSTSAYLGNGVSNGRMDVSFTILESSVSIVDEEEFVSTTSRCIKPYDLFDRILGKITGIKGIFRSSLFESGGKYEYMVVDNGFWARGFPDKYTDDDDEEKAIQFITSFKDAFDAFNYLEPLSWFTEFDGNIEVIRIETAKFTMNNFIGVTLNAVDDIKSEASKPDFFSKITIGHNKSMEYEEANGLDEPNGKSEFTTHITRNMSEYSISSPYRFDSVGYELTRRLQFVDYPREDTKRDENIFMHDAKYIGDDTVVHNLWQDVLDQAPTGIYDPATAWNLTLSPMNRLYYGHGYSVKRGLYHYPNNFIRFNSSNSNTSLKTIINGFELEEGGVLKISDIEKSRIEAEKVTLTFKMTQQIREQLDGYTLLNGKLVSNLFGLIEYKEKGEVRYGRLAKLESSEESKLILQKARL